MSRSIGVTVEFPAGHTGEFRVDINLRGEQVSQTFKSGRRAMSAALLVHNALHALADEHDEELAGAAAAAEAVKTKEGEQPRRYTHPIVGSYLDEAVGPQVPPDSRDDSRIPDDSLVVDDYAQTDLGLASNMACRFGGVLNPETHEVVDEESAPAGGWLRIPGCESPAPAKPLSKEMLESLQEAVDIFCPPAASEQAQDAQALGATAQGPPPPQTPMQVAVARVETRCATARELAAAGRRKALAGAYAEALALFRGAHQHALGASAALVSIEDFEGPQLSSDPARFALTDMRRVLLHIKSDLAAALWPAELREAIDILA